VLNCHINVRASRLLVLLAAIQQTQIWWMGWWRCQKSSDGFGDWKLRETGRAWGWFSTYATVVLDMTVLLLLYFFQKTNNTLRAIFLQKAYAHIVSYWIPEIGKLRLMTTDIAPHTKKNSLIVHMVWSMVDKWGRFAAVYSLIIIWLEVEDYGNTLRYILAS
jgi:hypothetical protein